MMGKFTQDETKVKIKELKADIKRHHEELNVARIHMHEAENRYKDTWYLLASKRIELQSLEVLEEQA